VGEILRIYVIVGFVVVLVYTFKECRDGSIGLKVMLFVPYLLLFVPLMVWIWPYYLLQMISDKETQNRKGT